MKNIWYKKFAAAVLRKTDKKSQIFFKQKQKKADMCLEREIANMQPRQHSMTRPFNPI